MLRLIRSLFQAPAATAPPGSFLDEVDVEPRRAVEVGELPVVPRVPFARETLVHGAQLLEDAVGELITELPLLNRTSQRAWEASVDDASFETLRGILEQDAALVTTILKSANSVRYAGARQIDGLEVALRRMGLKGLREVLMVAAATRLLVIPGIPDQTVRLQARGPAVGYCARDLATLLGEDPDAAFTAGLLHDIGWPAAFETARRIWSELPSSIQAEGGAGLHALVDFSHGAVGRRLAERWDLSEGAVAAIGHHHEPFEARGEAAKTPWMVHGAMILVDAVGYWPERIVADVYGESFLRRLELKTGQIDRLMNDLEEALLRDSA